jgi:hypothetical protein
MTAFLKELGVAEPAGLLDARQAPTNQMDLWEGLGGVSCSVLEAFHASSGTADVARSLNVSVHTIRRWAHSKAALQNAIQAWNTSPRGASVLSTLSSALLVFGAVGSP